MKASPKSTVLTLIGLAMSVIPPVIATISYFPLFKEKGGGAVVSGIAVLLLLISAIPLARTVKRFLRSPSARGIWILTFIVFFTLGRIAEEMTVISFVGAVSNIIGSVFFALAGRKKRNEKQD